MKLSSQRVLRSLSRWDSATVDDLARQFNVHTRTVWMHLQKLVEQGLATKSDDRIARYAITEAGRQALTAAA